MTPEIACLTVTKNRPDLIRSCIDQYARQTYPHKRLIIVSHGSPESNAQIRSVLASVGRTDIEFFEAAPSMSLGALRNLSVELAPCPILCQWDDDDYFHPNRIQSQYEALASNSTNVASCYAEFLKLFETTGDLYWCDWSGEGVLSSQLLCGAVMFRKEAFHAAFPEFYPELGSQSSVEEDYNVLKKLIALGGVAPVRSGHEYVYVYHGRNVYGEKHHRLTLDLSSGKRLKAVDHLLAKRKEIEETLRVGGAKRTMVRSQVDAAFVYEPAF